MSPADSAHLVEAGDSDELLRHVDRLCAARDWDGLVDLRDRCRRAVERGKQLWPVASHVEYRVALQAPGQWSGAMLEPDAGRFALGPLPEVAASTHTWEDLARWAPTGPARALAAHERVVRGEDLRAADVDASVLELPLVLQPWEPRYPVAAYRADEADFPSPDGGELSTVELVSPDGDDSDPSVTAALLDLVVAWTNESNGRAAVSAARLSGAAAPIGLADAMASMAWAGASGGAHGRRRGMAVGRFGAWWALAALTGLVDEWPVAPDRLGEAAEALRWFRWDTEPPSSGWVLRLAVEDPTSGVSWAIDATDRAE